MMPLTNSKTDWSTEYPIWDQAAETLPRAEREALQLERLRALVSRVARVPFYRDLFAHREIGPREHSFTG